jgi:dienelactone hydrolase
MNPRPAALCLAALATFAAPAAAQPLEADQAVERTLRLDPKRDGTWLIITPKDYREGEAYPVLVVFGRESGSLSGRDALAQTMARFDPACRERGWIVAGLVTPEGTKPGEPAIGDVLMLLHELGQRVRVEGRRVHLAGAGTGGVAALSVALQRPDLAASVLVFPGAIPRGSGASGTAGGGAANADRLRNLLPPGAGGQGEGRVPLRVIVGANDLVEATDAARELHAAAEKLGIDSKLDIRSGQGANILDLKPADLLDILEPLRVRLGTITPELFGPWRTLDALHAGAHLASEAAYFDLFAPEAVFIGTDASERWSVDEFRDYARPHFSQGKGWTYWPRERHVNLLPGGQAAWFDELLDNPKYGTARGSGVLRLEPGSGTWRIVQYNLSFPIPNDLAERVTRMIQTEQRRGR